MENKHRILITGASGYVGAMLVKEFVDRNDVEEVLGVDKEPKSEILEGISNFKHLETNTFNNDWVMVAREFKPDIVIHSAWQIREMYGKKELQRNWNVLGSKKVFEFAFSEPSVKRLIHFSTVASYGAYPDNSLDYRYRESDPFRKTDYLYAEEKREVEEILESLYEKVGKQNGKKVFVVRPAAITGPRGRFGRERFGLQSALSGGLKKSKSVWYKLVSMMVSFTPVTKKWARQFVHEDDIVDIVKILSLNDSLGNYEVFNAAPPGEVVLGSDMARAVNKKAIRISPILIRIAFFVLWHLSLGKIPVSRGGWKSYSYPILVDGSKITNLTGFKYKMSSKDAFVKKEGQYAELYI